jgi:hypothetical protein
MSRHGQVLPGIWRGYECTYAMPTHTYGRVGAGLGLLLDLIEQGHDQLSPVLSWFCGGFLCFFPSFFFSCPRPYLLGFFSVGYTHTNTTNNHTHKPRTLVCVCVCVCVVCLRVCVCVCVYVV